MDETHQQITDQPAKISFMDLCIHLKLGDGAWDDIDWMANVPAGTMWKMLIGHPIRRKVAEKALIALSELDGETCWTLDTIEVPLLSMPETHFVKAFRDCPMDYQTLVALAAHAGIARTVIDCMVVGNRVYREEAEKVLALLSLHTDRVWSFETTDVLLVPHLAEGEQVSYMALSAWELRRRGEQARKRVSTLFSKKRG